MKPEKVCRIVGACAILHNIAIMRNEPLEEEQEVEEAELVEVPAFEGRQDGRGVREHIARTFF